ncbi:MAG: DEAD/DEAH box helicase [Zoogloeaceae bacterium]|nr:DEAD/DEAH box helicase [Zoogloeaceae bacterium]
MTFANLGLAPELLRAVTESGYTVPTPIQIQAIPLVLAGRDVMGGAQTGTGKTAAFTLPLLQRLLPQASSSPSPARHPVRALILTPTRELAVQVFESVRTYSRHTRLRAMCAYGGVDIRPQIDELRHGVEILVATPGRLLDHVEQKTVHFNMVEMLVLDEADRMLDMGFIPDIRRILALLPQKRQSLLFSATFSDDIKKLADSMLEAPELVEVARRNQVSETITHQVHPVADGDRRALLVHLLETEGIDQCIVFTRTKQSCARLARELVRAGIGADAIHGDKSQRERLKTLEDFKAGTVRVLVATDVAARGLDIEDLPHVINYELPHIPEDYVHRIGRTGRAGRQGTAISLVAPAEAEALVNIERLIRITIPQCVIPGFEPEAEHAYPPDARKKRGGASEREKTAARKTTGEGRVFSRPAARLTNTMIAPDGFDFSKPYEPRGENPASVPPGPRPPQKKRRIVAALLGGLGIREGDSN